MKAITLHRPWAWAIASGHKDIENRDWKPYGLQSGDLLAIHAGKKWDKQGVLFIEALGITVPPEHEHPTGIIAIAQFFDCVDVEGTDSPWAVGGWCWRLGNVRQVSPIAIPGQQKLFNLSPEVERLLLLGDDDGSIASPKKQLSIFDFLPDGNEQNLQS